MIFWKSIPPNVTQLCPTTRWSDKLTSNLSCIFYRLNVTELPNEHTKNYQKSKKICQNSPIFAERTISHIILEQYYSQSWTALHTLSALRVILATSSALHPNYVERPVNRQPSYRARALYIRSPKIRFSEKKNSIFQESQMWYHLSFVRAQEKSIIDLKRARFFWYAQQTYKKCLYISIFAYKITYSRQHPWAQHQLHTFAIRVNNLQSWKFNCMYICSLQFRLRSPKWLHYLASQSRCDLRGNRRESASHHVIGQGLHNTT